MISSPRKPGSENDTQERPPLAKRKSSRIAKQTLAITYSRDPKGFEEVIKLHSFFQ